MLTRDSLAIGCSHHSDDFRKSTPVLTSRVKKRVPERVLQRAMHIIRSETLGRRLKSAKSLAESLTESLG